MLNTLEVVNRLKKLSSKLTVCVAQKSGSKISPRSFTEQANENKNS